MFVLYRTRWALAVERHSLPSPSNRSKCFIIKSSEVNALANSFFFFSFSPWKNQTNRNLCHVVRNHFNGNFMLHCLEIIAVKNATTIHE